MSPEIVVRRLESKDVALYRAIRLESLRLNPEAYGSAFETEEVRPLSAFSERLTQSHLLGCFEGDELVGIAGFQREEGPKRRHKGYVWGVYVRPEARGRGIARRLCEGVIEVARREVEVLQLTVTATNEPARRLYADLGFVEFGLERRAHKVNGLYYDDVLMAKELA